MRRWRWRWRWWCSLTFLQLACEALAFPERVKLGTLHCRGAEVVAGVARVVGGQGGGSVSLWPFRNGSNWGPSTVEARGWWREWQGWWVVKVAARWAGGVVVGGHRGVGGEG